MTIRKRYDEAHQLISLGLYEAALIIVLVAVAASAEKYRKQSTKNAKKTTGDDKLWFSKYVHERALSISMGKEKTAADILYKDLRCEIIHEAVLEEGMFSECGFSFAFNNGKYQFGIGLLNDLLSAIRRDPLNREEFRDVLIWFENMIEIAPSSSKREVWATIRRKYDISPGRCEIIEDIIKALTPEKLKAYSYKEMADIIDKDIISDLGEYKLNKGAVTGLNTVQVLEGNRLTIKGYQLIQEMSSYYVTVDHA